jgi:hypothetical protein
MRLFRHPGLLIALVWVAAMALAPIAAASGAGQGTDQLPGQAPGNGQGGAAPGQGIQPGIAGNLSGHSGPQDRIRGNMTAMNRTIHAPPSGNMTAPPGIPGWDTANSTAPQEFGNMTPPPFLPDGNTGNTTALNKTWHGHEENQSLPVQGLGNGINQGQPESQNSLIDEFFTWLKARTGS